MAKLIFFVMLCQICYCQPTFEWFRQYGTNNNLPYEMNIDANQNIILAGKNDNDYLVVKYSLTGALLWGQTYNGTANEPDWIRSSAVDKNNNIYVTGYTVETGNNEDCTTLKYSANGTLLWQDKYNFSPADSNDGGLAICTDIMGFVYVTGYSYSQGSSSDLVTIKYDSLGNRLWVTRYNGPAGNDLDYGGQIIADDLGNVFVGAWSKGSGTGFDFLVIKYDLNGVQIWQKRYDGGSSTDVIKDMKIDAFKNVYITGIINFPPNIHTGLIKYDSSGNQQWVRKIGVGNPSSFEPLSMDIYKTNAIHITGGASGLGTGEDIYSVKYTTNGDSVWGVRYDRNSRYQIAGDLKSDNKGNVYVCGFEDVSLLAGYDFVTLKYDSTGALLWNAYYSTSGNGSNDRAFRIWTDSLGNYIYVGGQSGNQGSRISVLKYSQLTPIAVNTGDVPKEFCLHKTYPNPFNPYTNINFDVAKLSNVRIQIYDLTGKLVANVIDESFEPGKYHYLWDASTFATGVYFCFLSAGDYFSYQKMVLIK